MKLSRTVAYALQATLLLAEDTSRMPVPCSKLAAEGKMPERFLLQILRNLVNHGLLRSTRGVDGGYMLLKKPHDITLLSIIEAIDGPVDAGLVAVEGLPQHARVILEEALNDVAVATRDRLGGVTLSNLLEKETV
ncbi:MAG: Rrf2 family transcriptional regulator [Planctomycetes bacterium]|nr:Rrf2 family transcriptional regulator [Planctomycetota bacterium]